MSKSKKNVVDPQQIIENFGADTARFLCYLIHHLIEIWNGQILE